jgi:TRAP-type uncharacterized transport system substrate-binding protein
MGADARSGDSIVNLIILVFSRRALGATAPTMLLALSLALVGCAESPDTQLRLVSGPPAANEEVAALLAGGSDEIETRVRVTVGARVADAEAALDALDAGTADLAIVENSSSYRHSGVRTVVPLYPSVLHIAVRPEKRGQTLREVFSGATVFAGTEEAAARQLLDGMASMYRWSGVEFSYVDSLESGPDVVFVFAPISPSSVPVLDGYELLSLGRAEDVGSGSGADGLALVAPFLRAFVIPEGTYGSTLTPTAIATVAVDTLLVTRADTSRVVVYDFLQAMQEMGPLLVARRPDLAIDELETFDISHVTFPVHAGTVAFRARNDPGFAERASGIFEVAVTLIAALATAVVALLRYLRGRRKSRIDKFYSEALAIRAKLLQEQDAQHRRMGIAELRTLRDRAFSLLINEKLSADESFRILQNLIGELIREFDPPAEQQRATTG